MKLPPSSTVPPEIHPEMRRTADCPLAARSIASVFGVFCLLLAMASVCADDGLILRDNFSDGEVATPEYSSAKSSWVIDHGSFAVDGTQLGENHQPSGGELNFGVNEKAQIRIDLGDVVESTPLTIRFTLSSSNGGLANDTFELELRDATSGEYYAVKMSGNAAYFAQADGAKSGFHGYNAEGNMIPATEGMRLEPGRPMAMEITFDDLTGVVLTLDGQIAAKWPNFKNLPRVDRIVFRTEGPVSWYLANFEIRGTLREK